MFFIGFKTKAFRKKWNSMFTSMLRSESVRFFGRFFFIFFFWKFYHFDCFDVIHLFQFWNWNGYYFRCSQNSACVCKQFAANPLAPIRNGQIPYCYKWYIFFLSSNCLIEMNCNWHKCANSSSDRKSLCMCGCDAHPNTSTETQEWKKSISTEIIMHTIYVSNAHLQSIKQMAHENNVNWVLVQFWRRK